LICITFPGQGVKIARRPSDEKLTCMLPLWRWLSSAMSPIAPAKVCIHTFLRVLNPFLWSESCESAYFYNFCTYEFPVAKAQTRAFAHKEIYQNIITISVSANLRGCNLHVSSFFSTSHFLKTSLCAWIYDALCRCSVLCCHHCSLSNFEKTSEQHQSPAARRTLLWQYNRGICKIFRKWTAGVWLHLVTLFIHFYYCLMMTDSVWQPKQIILLVIVLSILCGWVPLYWHMYLLISDTDCTRCPNRLMHVWVCGVAKAEVWGKWSFYCACYSTYIGVNGCLRPVLELSLSLLHGEREGLSGSVCCHALTSMYVCTYCFGIGPKFAAFRQQRSRATSLGVFYLVDKCARKDTRRTDK